MSGWPLLATLAQVGWTLGGLVAGEGSFIIRRRRAAFADGTERLSFGFQFSMATWDRPLVAALRSFLGVGSISEQVPAKAHWQTMAVLSVTSVKAHEAAVIPFAERFLLPSAKRDQFERWRDELRSYGERTRDLWKRERSVCSEPGCTGFVRGRGLCRHHYHLVTGY